MRLFDQNEQPLKTTQGHLKTSGKYQHINSLDICKQFESLGFNYLGTSSAKVRSEDRQGYQRHLMAFSRPDLVLSSGERMQILCLNSHDGTSALRFNIGVFRAACANGLVSGDIMHESRILHMGNIKEQISEQIAYLVNHAANVKDVMRAMQSTELSFNDSQEFLRYSADLRIDSPKLLRVDLSTIDKVRRIADKGQDLWRVFNRIQESVIKGGIKYEIQTHRKCPSTKEFINTIDTRTTREIKESKRLIDINKALWSKALEYVS